MTGAQSALVSDAVAVNPNGVDLGEVQRSLSLFAQGVLGRPLHLRTVDTTARDGRHKSILTDGQNLFLPVRIDDFATRRANLGAYRIAILHQIGYLQGGTFDFEPPDAHEVLAALHRAAQARQAASPGHEGDNAPADASPADGLPTDQARIEDPVDLGPVNSSDSLASMSLWRIPGISARRRSAALERFFINSPHPALLRRVFAIVEAIRIDARIQRHYPGARADLARVHQHALATRPDPAAMRPHTALIEALVQHSLGARFAPRDTADPLTQLLALITPITKAGARAALSACISLAICALLARVVSLRPIRRLLPVTSGEALTSSLGELADSAGSSLSIDGEDEKKAAGADGAEPDAPDDEPPEAADDGAPPGQGGDTAPSGARADLDDLSDMGDAVAFHGVLAADLIEQSRNPLRSRRTVTGVEVPIIVTDEVSEAKPADAKPDAPEPVTDADAAGTALAARPARRPGDGAAQRSFLYDEWDYLEQRYRKAWCRVLEERLQGDDTEFIGDVRRRHALLAAQVRRQFAGIKPDAFRRVHRTPDGEEIELSSLIDAVIDRRSGHYSDESLYVRRERAQREVSAAFLVDMSASTDFPIPVPPVASGETGAPDGVEPGNTEHHAYLYGGFQDWDNLVPPPPRRRVMDVQKDAIALMCDALHKLGDSYAVYGFSGEGRHQVEFKLIKDFADRLGSRTWAALAAMKPRRSTRMGPAIRHAASKLLREPTRRKVLIIVSDGYPEDDDYGPERGDAEYGIRDTARALQEAESAGLTTFCITVDPAGHDYLRRMSAQERYLVIDDVAALPDELTKVYRTLTA